MIIPVRCFSCGTLIGGKWEKFKEEVESGKDPKKVLDSLGLKNYCCRTMFITQVDLLDKVSRFKIQSVDEA
ncbi:MAG: DNA-directed RNA polymerase subunit N [Candidatus Aenigmarchaeota archaeon]|nr:DNA-directed RNA polymerase subunit N [Candidatus Aenigmarchaeota archaeon]MCK5321774.1 DNA-directed RNA polymerase subunit N [Candidatus Aenigmarchaeota archaeon]